MAISIIRGNRTPRIGKSPQCKELTSFPLPVAFVGPLLN